MGDDEFSQSEVPNRRTAVAVHRRLRDANAPLIKLGMFYRAMLERKIWGNQKSMATELGVSTAQLSRMVVAARLPQEVLALFGEKQQLAFRDVATLNTLIHQYGEAEIAKRASAILPGAPLGDIFSLLTTGRRVPRKGVKVSIARGGKYLRVEAPNLAQIAPRVKEVEEVLNALLGLNGSQTFR